MISKSSRRDSRSPSPPSNSRRSESSVGYHLPEAYIHLSELTAPPPVQNLADAAPIYQHESLEDEVGVENAPSNLDGSPIRHHRRQSSNAHRGAKKSRIELHASRHSERKPSRDEYSVPEDYENLNEAAVPEPVENPDESPIYRHHSLEERFEPAEASSAGRDASPGGAVSPRSTLHQTIAGYVSLPVTELYTVSYLVFFSIVGTLARLGLQTLTTYPGAPATFGLLWVNFAGTLVMGFLAEASRIFAPPIEDDDIISSPGPKQGNGSDGGVGSATDTDLGVVESGLNSTPLADMPVAEGLPPSQPPPASLRPASSTRRRKPMPLYIGLATGFCGSVTSFSSFILDAFLALLNALPSPPTTTPPPRTASANIMALLAILLLTLCTSLSALQLGAHAAIALTHILPQPTTFPRRALRILDNAAVVLGLGGWAAAAALTARWRGALLFAVLWAPAGCLVRFWVSVRLNGVARSFPLGTFVVNVVGTGLLGGAWDMQRGTGWRASGVGWVVLQGFMDGFCGCLTTVSTWVAELRGLRRGHAYLYGGVSVVASFVVLVVVMGTLRWTVGWREQPA